MNISVDMKNDELVIRVPKDFVYATLVFNPQSSLVSVRDSDDFPDHCVLRDFDQFSVYLMNAIRGEDEIGWSLVNDLIFRAGERALENGADGVIFPEG